MVTGAADRVHRNGATLHGTVNPGGGTTTYVFEFGATTSYGSQTAPKDAGAGAAVVPAAAAVASLEADRTYHYRLVATNVSGTTAGADTTFSTKRSPVKTFTARVTPLRDRLLPFRFTITGKIVPPAVKLRSEACKGVVSLRATLGRSKITSRATKLKRSCRYSLKVAFGNDRRLGRSGRLRFTVRFGGNDVLKPKARRPLAVSYG